MTSKIYELLNKYENEAYQQRQWPQNREGKQSNIVQYTQGLGDYFLRLLIYDTLKHESSKLSQEQFLDFKDVIGLGIQKKFNLGKNHIEQIFGIFISKKLKQISQYEDIKNQIKIICKMIQQNSLLEDIPNIQYQNQQQFKEHNSFQQQKILFQSFLKELQQQQKTQGSVIPLFQINKDYHQKQIRQYLSKLSNPQSQLTYLYQNLNWKMPIFNHSDRGHSCKLYWQWQNQKGFIQKQSKALSKKQGNFETSLKILQQLYNRFPNLLKYFQKIKNYRKIQITTDNQKSNFRTLSEKKQQVKKQIVSPSNAKQTLVNAVNQYLSNINSYKTQMSYLLQNFKGKIDHQKQQKGKYWNVQSVLSIFIQDELCKYQYSNSHMNSKIGQQTSTENILKQLYINHPILWFKWKKIKQDKKIKT